MNVNKNTDSDLTVALGQELRALRKAHGLTLQTLAERAGKSVGFISKIERGLARPSITALQDIAEVLEVPIGWFFQQGNSAEQEERRYIVRREQRRRLHYTGGVSTDYMGFEDTLLSAQLDGQLALGISRYQPGGTAGDDHYSHEGEEAGLVLEGELELTLDGQVYLLRAGDSFSFQSALPHTYRNPGEVETLVVWANTPITLRRHAPQTVKE